MDELEELRQRCTRLEKIVCMLARADLAHLYGKDLHRAGPLQAFKALGHHEDLQRFDRAMVEDEL